MADLYNAPNGWFKNKNFGIYQKVNGQVYAYVNYNLNREFQVSLYQKGTTLVCELEFRTPNPLEAFQKGEEWLQKYSDGNLEQIRQDYFSPHNPNSFWAKEYPNM